MTVDLDAIRERWRSAINTLDNPGWSALWPSPKIAADVRDLIAEVERLRNAVKEAHAALNPVGRALGWQDAALDALAILTRVDP